MKESDFRIQRKWPSKRVVLGVLSVYAIAIPVYLYFGFQSSSSVSVSAYAKEISEASGLVEIPGISLSAPVSEATLDGRTLSVPNYIIGKYQTYENKVLLMGHSSTVFKGLPNIMVGDKISYNGRSYRVFSKEVLPKSEISMREILKDEEVPTITLMTCAGEHISGQDYSHRLVINAVVSGE